ncbi:MAG: transposase [Flavobacteriales bacterium]
MRTFFTAIATLVASIAFSQNTPIVVLNELNMDNPGGTDQSEFVELYGAPNTSLDSIVVVLFEGTTDLSYAAFDLDGYSLDNNGFFVIGNAAAHHGKPEIINSGQGTQFTSEDYITCIKSLGGVKISMDGKGRATDNAHIERFFRTIKHDRLYLNPSKDGQELYRECEDFINYYNQRRSHSSIGKAAPAQVYKKAA